MRGRLGWILLGLLLAATLVGAAALDRRSWPGFVGDEATYLMQAESLAWDLDLRYTRADYDRFVAHWGETPEGLILQSGDGGETLTYGKPAFYSLAIAPFVRLSPTRGAPVANALLLALAGVLAGRTLARRMGSAAPWWVAAFLFASVTFAYVFWAHADLFLMVLTAVALALAYGGARRGEEPAPEIYTDVTLEPAAPYLLRWAAVGALLAVVAFSRPFYAALLLPAALAVPAARRRQGLLALAAGTALTALLAAGVNLAVHHSWTSYGGERRGFYSHTGFPQVELPAAAWREEVDRRGTGSWVAPEKILPYDFEPRLTAWNLLYLAAGRHVGLLAYFLPLLLGFAAYRRGEGRWALVVAAGLAVAAFLYVRPFNFWGGGGAIANRYFLPVYPAFWFLSARSVRPVWALVAAAAAAPFLYPLWLQPRAYPLTPEGGLRHVSPVARAWLPYETTQDHLKPAGTEDVVHRGLWVKLLRPGMRPAAGGGWLVLGPEPTGEVLLASHAPLHQLLLEMAPPAPSRITLEGGELGSTALRPDGGSAFQVLLGSPRARHRMWWTDRPLHLYQLRFTLPEDQVPARPLRFRLLPQ